MKQFMQTHIRVALALIVLVGAIMIGTFVASERQKEIEDEIRNHIEQKQVVMFTLAELTDRNGADETVESIISDCGRRPEYEGLLVRLGELPKRELVQLQSLFESCGYFEAERKALMVATLDREFRSYEESLGLLDVLTAEEQLQYPREAWGDIVKHEKLRSALLSDLSNLQEEIISALILGSSVQSVKVRALVESAQNIGQLLIVYDERIDSKRKEVNP